MSQADLKETNFAVKAGFTAMLMLVLVFGVFSLYQLKNITSNMTRAIESSSQKIVHVIVMRDVIRQRQVTMTKMLLMDDVFKREESRMEFFSLSGIFRAEREDLEKLPINSSEKKLLSKILKNASIAQEINREAINLLMEDYTSEQGRDLILQAQKAQREIHSFLGDFIGVQNKNIQISIIDNKKQYKKTLTLSILIGLIIALLAWLIARYMARIITQKNKELVNKNNQLEDVSKQALEATRTKSEFLATMSHEIRTPLTSIIGFAEVLSAEKSHPEDREGITKTIIKNGNHLLKIINDILDISKIEANRMSFEKTYFSPVELITDIEATIKNEFIKKGVQLYLEYDFPIPNTICNDELRIKQIILNLCSNALKFTDAGKVCIKIHCDIDSEKMYFTIIDSGIGLTDEQMEKVFDAFIQADQSTTRKYGGTGLGLFLSKQFAEKMGGTITVKSLLGIGSQFCVSISTGRVDSQQLIIGEAELPETEDSIKYHFDYSHLVKGSILIAEDNFDNQQLLSILLSDIGASLTFVDNGQLAVEEALLHDYDLIFMDMQMPIMGGLEATEKLRDANYKNPIVALTANAMKSDHDACINAGCNDFITKPINKEKIFQTIYRYLEIINKKTNDDVIDFQNFEKRSEKMRKLTISFISGLAARIKKIEDSRNKLDFHEMKMELHKIKGVGTSMGYPILTEAAAELEYEVMQGDRVEIDRLLVKMKEVCKKVEKNNALT